MGRGQQEHDAITKRFLDNLRGSVGIAHRVEEYELDPVFTQSGMTLGGKVYRRGASEIVSRAPHLEIPKDKLTGFAQALRQLENESEVNFPDTRYSNNGFDLATTPYGISISFEAVCQGGSDFFCFYYEDSPESLAQLIDESL